MTGGSLARRILFLSLFFLVIPLLIYAFFAFQADYRMRMRDLFLTLDTFGKGEERLLETRIDLQHQNLHLFSHFLDFEHPRADLNQRMQEIAKRENYSSFFFLTKLKTQETICTFSTDPNMVTKTNLFSSEIDKILGEGAFLGVNPSSQLKELYISAIVTSSSSKLPLGYLICGTDAQKLLCRSAKLEGIPYPFHLTLLTEKDQPFVSSDPTFSLNEINLLTTEDVVKQDESFFQFAKVEEKSSFWNLFKKEKSKEKMGLKLPVEESHFTLLIDLPEKIAFASFKKEFVFRFSKLLLLLVFVGGILSWVVMKRMARPLKSLAKTMARVKEGHLSSRYEKDLLGFEINILGERFNQMVEGLITTIEEVKTERVAKELLLRELKIGHEIQKSIFPKEIPEIAGLEIASGFLPAHEVTGDFYDLFERKENSQSALYFAIGDAAGKGISASLFALTLRSALRAVCQSVKEPLDLMLERVNRLFCQDTRDSGYFATGWVGKIDLSSLELSYSSCGHLPTLLLREGKTLELTMEGTALGVEEETHIETKSIQLFPGDLLILYSDGVIEAHNPQKELFGAKRLHESLLQLRDPSPQKMISHILQQIEGFTQHAPQHDDITLLLLKIKG
jgi:sigma-B regulation protein RsbU (phosphoserine phosphatase)